MENESKLHHEFLIRLDNDLSDKLYNHAQENDMKITGVVRRSLRLFFDGIAVERSAMILSKNEEYKNEN